MSGKTNMNQETTVIRKETSIVQQEGAPIPNTFWGYVKGFGPGIVVVLTWLGAGDLVDASVAGANYGYTLMWALAIALLVRFALVNTIAKFQLFNPHKYSIIQAYGKLHPYYPAVLGSGSILYGYVSAAYCLSGASYALYHLTNLGNPIMWSVVNILLALLITGRSVYKQVEFVQKIILAVMTVCLVGVAVMAGFQPGEALKGVFLFELPNQKGAYDSIIIAISLIGAVGGSIANLLYPEWMKQKGYITPKHRKVQRYDLLFATIMMIILNLSVWVVGAEILHPRGITVNSVDDLGNVLGQVLGRPGEIIIYLAVWAATFSTFLGGTDGYIRLAFDGFYSSSHKRKEKYEGNYRKDPAYKYIYFLMLILPIIWVFPNMPGFVQLTVVSNAALVFFLPIISIGLLIIINKKSIYGDRAHNIVDTAIVGILSVFALWSVYKIVATLIHSLIS
ncbi:Mn2+/Fe2+ NRAMP family transporter [Scopulibacillus darangshiensis]|uniref:Mn2+/Fe2+ NRAMP family transporter n=1 Tax=Scopulibacillus darangshiensis TaxID=442528 RepID=A0A4R2NPT0_9BACL|nr:Nramp family divalent metal transporter [Scopulibacillus darangshiensis]TCP23757.1 Mn2+/Fe2+ NRAMP family transporter [Scopulibacillus darangshiensis]